MPMPRYALAYTPPPDSPLARFGASVIGYDCFHRVEVQQRAVTGIAPAILALATIEPRRSGFRGMFVEPFTLDGREHDLVDAVDQFARSHLPVPLGPLVVDEVDGLVVLRPAIESARLDELAAACRAGFEPFHGLLDDADTEGEFRFRMVLAGPIPNGDAASFADFMRDAFAGFAADQIEIDAISLLKQGDPAGRFHVLARRRLTGR